MYQTMTIIRNFFAASFCMALLFTQFSCRKDSSTVTNSKQVEAVQPSPDLPPQPPFHSYEVRISGPVTLGDTWVEFHPEPYLKPDNDWQEVGLELERPFNTDFFDKGKGPNKGKGILMPDGDVINPEIEVVDQNGNVFALVWVGAFVPGNGKGGTARYDRPYPQKFPRDREYKAVRIRSSRTIKCKAIYWFSQSVKDMP